MKLLRRCSLGFCVLAAVTAGFAASKARTFTVVGYYDRSQPNQELVAKAAAEVGAKMKNCVSVGSEEDADQIVQVLFKRDGTYRIYWDALPLAGKQTVGALDRFKQAAYDNFDRQMENAEGRGRGR